MRKNTSATAWKPRDQKTLPPTKQKPWRPLSKNLALPRNLQWNTKKLKPASVRHLPRPSVRMITAPPLPAFLAVFSDPAAWGSLLYMLVSLVTGIIYFTWAVTGISLSVGLLVLIISLPFIGLFFLSVRGLALVEGRIVEALLGVRMPRRPIFLDSKLSWWGRFKVLFTSKHTWLAMVYMILMLPLGVIYFSVFVTLISLALELYRRPAGAVVIPLPAGHD
ncbi:MAG: sensor domain-containing protein [Anaerolineaceae bacterium]